MIANSLVHIERHVVASAPPAGSAIRGASPETADAKLPSDSRDARSTASRDVRSASATLASTPARESIVEDRSVSASETQHRTDVGALATLAIAWTSIVRVARLPHVAAAVVALWLLVSAIGGLGLLRGLSGLRRIKRAGVPLDDDLVRKLRRLRHATRLGRAAELRSTSDVDVPVAVGFRAPAILLPSNVLESGEVADIDQIAMHEYAHLNRYDDWTNLLQHAIERVMWFNPVMAFAGRRIALEREIACDDWVVAQTGRAHRYATCLWKLVEASRTPVRSSVAPGAFASRKAIATRIERLLDSRRNAVPRLSPGAAFALGAIAVACVVFSMNRSPVIAIELPSAAPAVAAIAPASPVDIARVGHAAVVPHVAVAPRAALAPLAPKSPLEFHHEKPVMLHGNGQVDSTVPTVVTWLATRVATTVASKVSTDVGSAMPSAVASAISRAASESAQAIASAPHVVADTGIAPRDARTRVRDCQGCDLDGADLRNADLHGLSINGVSMQGADLRNADLARAHLQGVDLSDAKLSGADLTSAVLTGTDLSGADLSGAKLEGIKLTGTDIHDARFANANMRSLVANCTGCDLSHVDLHGQDLHGITLAGADFSGADLRGANLRDARFSGVDFSGARFDGADLRGARIVGCDIEAAQLKNAKTDPNTLDDRTSYLRSNAGSARDAKRYAADLDIARRVARAEASAEIARTRADLALAQAQTQRDAAAAQRDQQLEFRRLSQSLTRVSSADFSKISRLKIEMPTTDLQKIEIPKIDLPQIEAPTVVIEDPNGNASTDNLRPGPLPSLDPKALDALKSVKARVIIIDDRDSKVDTTSSFVIPEVHIPAVTIPPVTIPEQRIPSFTIPEHLDDAGNLVPARTVPERVIPGRTIPGRVIPERTIPARTVQRHARATYDVSRCRRIEGSSSDPTIYLCP
jgi:uncharacterized protein YjbI with pentapeptide repeats/beta-lactamase regulating signal transducer with metallopeptidase domain